MWLVLDLRPVLRYHSPGPNARGRLPKQFSALEYSIESQQADGGTRHESGSAARVQTWAPPKGLGLDLRPVLGCHTPGPDVRGHFSRKFSVLQYSMESQRCYYASKHKPGYAAPLPIWVTFLWLGLDLRPVLGCHTPGPDVRGHFTRQFSVLQYSMASQRCYCASKHKPGYAAPSPFG